MAAGRGRLARVFRALTWLGALGGCLLAWWAGPLAAAAVTTEPAWFLGVGTLAAVVLWLLACRLLLRTRTPWRRATARLAGVLVVATTLVGVLLPMDDPRRAPRSAPDAGTWVLEDGSELAFGVVRGDGDAEEAPVLALHGGPGVPDTAGLLDALGRWPPTGTTCGPTTSAEPAAPPAWRTRVATRPHWRWPTWSRCDAGSEPSG